MKLWHFAVLLLMFAVLFPGVVMMVFGDKIAEPFHGMNNLLMGRKWKG